MTTFNEKRRRHTLRRVLKPLERPLCSLAAFVTDVHNLV